MCVCVCVCRSLHLHTPTSFKGVQHVGLCLILVKVGESGRASKHVYQAISRLAGRSLGGLPWSILHWWLDTQKGIISYFLSVPWCPHTHTHTHSHTHTHTHTYTRPLCWPGHGGSSSPYFRSGSVMGNQGEQGEGVWETGSRGTVGALGHHLYWLLAGKTKEV